MISAPVGGPQPNGDQSEARASDTASHRLGDMPATDPTEDLAALANALDLPAAVLAHVLPVPVHCHWRPGDERREYLDLLPDGWWFCAGDPILVLVGVTSDGVTVAVPEVRWAGQTPVIDIGSSDVLSHKGSPEGRVAWLQDRIPAAIEIRRASFKICERCGEETPPEWMLDDEICQSCGAADGVVF